MHNVFERLKLLILLFGYCILMSLEGVFKGVLQKSKGNREHMIV